MLPIGGMTCAACQAHVQRALRGTPGVLDATVNLMTQTARVVYNGAETTPAAVVSAVEESGYEATLPQASDDSGRGADAAAETEEGRLRWYAIFTLGGGLLAMILSLPLMGSTEQAGFWGFAGQWSMRLFPALYLFPPQMLRLVLLAMAALAMLWTGASVYLRAGRALLHGATNMNTLVALGTGAAFFYSAAATLRPWIFLRHHVVPHTYFEAVLFILGFLLLGSWLDLRAKRRTLDAVRAFARLQPSMAHLLRSETSTDPGADANQPVDSEIEVPVAAVLPGDTVIVRPGERLPVDGTVLRGRSSVDESLVTGESIPVAKGVGDALIGGSLNYDGALEYRATSIGHTSVLGQMLRLMQEAQSSRAPMQALADRVSAVFVPAVLALASLTFLVWGLLDHTGGFSRGFAIAIAVLVIACPCAMGLAVPAALTVAIGRGAQLGVLFKGGEAVERLAGVNAVVLDKTGTITAGTPRVTDVSGENPDHLLTLAAALEARSEHPFARAILGAAQERSLPALAADTLTVHPGLGLSGSVDGTGVLVGNERLLAENGIAIPPSLDLAPADLSPAAASPSSLPGVTLLHIATDGSYAGAIACRDTLRPQAAAVVAQLRSLGLSVAMLTGDAPLAAESIAREAGIAEVHAGLLPSQKLDQIQALQAAGRKVLMVGDGINDAAALAQADAGLAMGTGTDLAREAGDAILLRGDLHSVVAAVELARRTRRVMRQNLGWALVYNIIGIPIAAGVLYPAFGILLSPALASAAMALSSVSVLANSLRIKRFHPAQAPPSGRARSQATREATFASAGSSA